MALYNMISKIFIRYHELKIFDKILSVLSLFFGGGLTIDSAYLIWAYNFTGGLFLFMFPMTILITEFIIGLVLTFAGVYTFVNSRTSVKLYNQVGVLMILYPLNNFIMDVCMSGYYVPIIMLPIGLFLYMLIIIDNKESNKKQIFLIYDLFRILIGIGIFILIDVLFG